MKHISLFTSARIKLTVTYILIFMVISGVISGLFYYQTSRILEAEYNRIDRRLQIEINGQIFTPPQMRMRRIQPEDLETAKHQIIIQLFKINGLIILVVAGLGYVLSGLTLAPIQQALENQKRFVADAAHELRTPITALKTSLEVSLMDKKVPKPIKELLSENLDDAIRLEEITNGLLTLSKFDFRPLERESVNLSLIINQSLKYLRPLAAKKKIKLIYQPSTSVATVMGDSSVLVDVINIFLDNAIKYSPARTTITISTLRSGQNCLIHIQDQGIGIAKADLKHIFDRFYQVDSSHSKTDHRGGYGLGLSIAKRIVEEHHGSIHVESQLSVGTTFTITLPRA